MSARIPSLTLALLIAMTGAAAAGQKAPSNTLPAAVKNAFEHAHPKATIDHWAAEKKDGQPVFEIESHEGQQKRDLLYAADGRLIESEEMIEVASLPDAVRQAVTKAYPKATMQKAERVVRGQVTEYEVSLKGAKVKEMVLHADGTLVK